MRIAVSGTANTGKSTLIKDFITVWNNYSTPEETYRDLLVNESSHSSKTTKQTQQKVLDFLVKTQTAAPTENIIYDRCALDNIIYSMWAVDKGVGDIDADYVQSVIPIVRDSIKNLDIILWLPYSEQIPVAIDNLRDTDITYIKEIDNIFRTVYEQFLVNDKFPLFDPEDRPAIIEIHAVDRNQRLLEIANYIDLTGEAVPPDEEWASQMIAQESEARDAVEQLLTDEKNSFAKETGGQIII